jgi:asparagine N-glycosylation enzyme membrane subunit Stt3
VWPWPSGRRRCAWSSDPAFEIDRVDLALLAVATAGLMLVTTLGQALIATARYRSAALAPLLGVAVFVVARRRRARRWSAG